MYIVFLIVISCVSVVFLSFVLFSSVFMGTVVA